MLKLVCVVSLLQRRLYFKHKMKKLCLKFNFKALRDNFYTPWISQKACLFTGSPQMVSRARNRGIGNTERIQRNVNSIFLIPKWGDDLSKPVSIFSIELRIVSYCSTARFVWRWMCCAEHIFLLQVIMVLLFIFTAIETTNLLYERCR